MRIHYILLPYVVAASALVSTAVLKGQLHAARTSLSPQQLDLAEALYLPDADAVRGLSFDFVNPLADLLWFSTISYFGKHYKGDRTFRWLAHRCTLIQELTPRSMHVAEFCALMLAWEANDPKASIDVLTRAIEVQPDNWKLFYQRGFNRYFFLKDNAGALKDFQQAALLPGTHPVVVRLASKKLAELEGPSVAVAFLRERIHSTTDTNVRSTLLSRLRELESGQISRSKDKE